MCKVKKMRANMELKLKIRAVLQLSLFFLGRLLTVVLSTSLWNGIVILNSLHDK